MSLRKNSSNGYSVPYGGMFSYVSCPNFLGEIIEWLGFALMSWSIAALAFALWTVFNLLPRAIDHHNFYKNTFKDYPAERKAVIPFIL
jgi:steroid 5-alpha reductase family enzyme